MIAVQSVLSNNYSSIERLQDCFESTAILSGSFSDKVFSKLSWQFKAVCKHTVYSALSRKGDGQIQRNTNGGTAG